MISIKTASDLKFHHETLNPGSHFFTRTTMKFFGDTMRNYSVRQPQTIKTYSGTASAFELVRRHPVKHGLVASAYFDATTLKRVYPQA